MSRKGFLSSLRFQIPMAISLLVITAMVLMGLFVSYLARHFIIEEKRRLGMATAVMIQRELSNPTSAEAAAGEDGVRRLAERVAAGFHDGAYSHSITAFDAGHAVVWSTLPRDLWPYSKVFGRPISFMQRGVQSSSAEDPKTGNEMLVFRFPWMIGPAVVGSCQLVIPAIAPGQELLFSGKLIIAIAAGYAFIVIMFGVLLLKQMVTNPVRELNRAVRRLMAGERNVSLPESEENELGMLAHSFNEMARELTGHERGMSDKIEELLAVNEELEQTRRGLIRTEKLAGIGRLAAGIAHEVGNPLSAILGYVDLLKEGGLEKEDERDFLFRIETDVTRIHTIITGLLDYSRPEKERIERLDFNSIIEDTTELLKPQQQFKQMSFDFSSHLDKAWVHADRHQLQQVLVNLFVNAAHAMNEEGVITIFLERVLYDPSLTYRQTANKFRSGESLVTVSVIDHGVGIDEEEQGLIFDPFYTTKEPGQGTGLGLSVCDKIIDSFGGSLEVTSRLGEGATFTILIQEDIGKEEGE